MPDETFESFMSGRQKAPKIAEPKPVAIEDDSFSSFMSGRTQPSSPQQQQKPPAVAAGPANTVIPPRPPKTKTTQNRRQTGPAATPQTDVFGRPTFQSQLETGAGYVEPSAAGARRIQKAEAEQRRYESRSRLGQLAEQATGAFISGGEPVVRAANRIYGGLGSIGGGEYEEPLPTLTPEAKESLANTAALDASLGAEVTRGIAGSLPSLPMIAGAGLAGGVPGILAANAAMEDYSDPVAAAKRIALNTAVPIGAGKIVGKLATPALTRIAPGLRPAGRIATEAIGGGAGNVAVAGLEGETDPTKLIGQGITGGVIGGTMAARSPRASSPETSRVAPAAGLPESILDRAIRNAPGGQVPRTPQISTPREPLQRTGFDAMSPGQRARALQSGIGVEQGPLPTLGERGLRNRATSPRIPPATEPVPARPDPAATAIQEYVAKVEEINANIANPIDKTEALRQAREEYRAKRAAISQGDKIPNNIVPAETGRPVATSPRVDQQDIVASRSGPTVRPQDIVSTPEVADQGVFDSDLAMLMEDAGTPEERATAIQRLTTSPLFPDAVNQFNELPPKQRGEILRQVPADLRQAIKTGTRPVTSRPQNQPQKVTTAPQTKMTPVEIPRENVENVVPGEVVRTENVSRTVPRATPEAAPIQESAPANPELEALTAKYKADRERIRSGPGNRQEISSRLRGLGERYAAEKRRLTGTLTAKEQKQAEIQAQRDAARQAKAQVSEPQSVTTTEAPAQPVSERQPVPIATADNVESLRNRRAQLVDIEARRGSDLNPDLQDEIRELGSSIKTFENKRLRGQPPMEAEEIGGTAPQGQNAQFEYQPTPGDLRKVERMRSGPAKDLDPFIKALEANRNNDITGRREMAPEEKARNRYLLDQANAIRNERRKAGELGAKNAPREVEMKPLPKAEGADLITKTVEEQRQVVKRRKADYQLKKQGENLNKETENKAELNKTVTHPDETINGQPIIARTQDGRVIVPNEANKSGVSVVRDRAESRPPERENLTSRRSWRDVKPADQAPKTFKEAQGFVGDVRSEYRQRSGEREGTLYLNQQGTAVLSSAAKQAGVKSLAGGFEGVNMNLGSLQKAGDLLRSKAEHYGESGKSLTALADQIDTAIADARAQGYDAIPVVDVASSPGARIKKVVREEDYHGWQRRVGLLSDERGGQVVERFKDDPTYQHLRKELLKDGYPEDEITLNVEAAAKLASGQAESFGVDVEKANDYLHSYYNYLADTFGPEVLEQNIRVSPQARRSLEDVREIRGIQRSARTAPGGNQGQAGAVAGRGREGAVSARRVASGLQGRGAEGSKAADVAPGQTQREAQSLPRRPQQRDLIAGLRRKAEPKSSTVPEKTSTFRKAGFLGGIPTHARNVLGNAIFQGSEAVARGPAALVDIGLSAATGRRSVPGWNKENLGAGLRGAKQGYAEAKEIMKHGQRLEDIAASQRDESHFKNKYIKGYTDFIFKSLSAEDAIFRNIARQRALEGLAKVQAINEARAKQIPRSQIRARQKELIERPTPELNLQAIADAEVAVFQNKNRLSEAVAAGRKELSPGGKLALDLFLPYDKTPTNIVLKMLDYSPAGLLRATGQTLNAVGRGFRAARDRKAAIRGGSLPDPGFKERVKLAIKDAIPQSEQKKFAETIGRSLTGTGAFLATGAWLASKGLLTGFYGDPDEEKRNQELGKQPGSLLIGGRSYQIAGFGPPGMLLVLGATMAREGTKPLKDESKRYGNVYRATENAITENIPLFEAGKQANDVFSGQGNVPQRLGRLAGGFIPTVGNVGKLLDPYDREAGTFGSEIQKQIPIARNFLPRKQSVTGEDVQPGFVERAVGLVDPTGSKPIKENAALEELEAAGMGVGTSKQKAGESDEAFKARSRDTQKMFQDAAGKIRQSDKWVTLTGMQRRKVLESLKARAGKQTQLDETERNVMALDPDTVIDAVLRSEEKKVEKNRMRGLPASR